MRGHVAMEVLENCYLVNFEVDNGACHTISNAVVFAINPDDAINKVKEFISSKDNDTDVEQVFFCHEFTGSVFTDKFGWQ